VAYGKAVTLDPEAGWPLGNLALSLVAQGKIEEAIPLYKKSIDLLNEVKDKAICWNRLGNAYRKLNNYEEAFLAFQKADQLDGDNTGFRDKLDEALSSMTMLAPEDILEQIIVNQALEEGEVESATLEVVSESVEEINQPEAGLVEVEPANTDITKAETSEEPIGLKPNMEMEVEELSAEAESISLLNEISVEEPSNENTEEEDETLLTLHEKKFNLVQIVENVIAKVEQAYAQHKKSEANEELESEKVLAETEVVNAVSEEAIQEVAVVNAISEEAIQEVEVVSAVSEEAVQEVEVVNAISEEAIQEVEVVSAVSEEAVQEVEVVNAVSKEIVQEVEVVNAVSEEIVQEVEVVNAVSEEAVQEVEVVNAVNEETTREIEAAAINEKASLDEVEALTASKETSDEAESVVAEIKEEEAAPEIESLFANEVSEEKVSEDAPQSIPEWLVIKDMTQLKAKISIVKTKVQQDLTLVESVTTLSDISQEVAISESDVNMNIVETYTDPLPAQLTTEPQLSDVLISSKAADQIESHAESEAQEIPAVDESNPTPVAFVTKEQSVEFAYEEYLKDATVSDKILTDHVNEIQSEAPITKISKSGEMRIEMDTKNAHVWNELGNIYLNSGTCDDAIASYSKAIELDRQFAWPYSNLALAYVQKGRFAEAILLYQRSIELFTTDKDKAITWNRLGNVYRRINDYGNAIDSYQTADELDPENATLSLRSSFGLLGSMYSDSKPAFVA
jgi:tetratricopeptide (TPR) repeat protein